MYWGYLYLFLFFLIIFASILSLRCDIKKKYMVICMKDMPGYFVVLT